MGLGSTYRTIVEKVGDCVATYPRLHRTSGLKWRQDWGEGSEFTSLQNSGLDVNLVGETTPATDWLNEDEFDCPDVCETKRNGLHRVAMNDGCWGWFAEPTFPIREEKSPTVSAQFLSGSGDTGTRIDNVSSMPELKVTAGCETKLVRPTIDFCDVTILGTETPWCVGLYVEFVHDTTENDYYDSGVEVTQTCLAFQGGGGSNPISTEAFVVPPGQCSTFTLNMYVSYLCPVRDTVTETVVEEQGPQTPTQTSNASAVSAGDHSHPAENDHTHGNAGEHDHGEHAHSMIHNHDNLHRHATTTTPAAVQVSVGRLSIKAATQEVCELRDISEGC